MKTTIVILSILFLTSCVNDNTEDLYKEKHIVLNKDTTKSVVYHDFNFFKLCGKEEYQKNDSSLLIKITYDNDGKILFTENLFFGGKPGCKITYKHDSNLVIGTLIKPAEWEANVNYIFKDTVVIVTETSLNYLRGKKDKVLNINRISILNQNLTKRDYYFSTLDVIIKNETDFKYEYLKKAYRTDYTIFTINKNIVTVDIKSNYPDNNKKQSYYCKKPFSLYWWYLYEDLMYQPVNNDTSSAGFSE